MNPTTTPDTPARRSPPQENSRILSECRDLAVDRLLVTLSAIMDNVAAMLMERAGNTDVREEQNTLLDARAAVLSERKSVMSAFETDLRRRFNERVSGKEQRKADFSLADGSNLSLVDNRAMDESVLTGNIARGVENLCYEELQTLNRGVGYLLGDPELGTGANPLAPVNIIESFAHALDMVKAGERVKFAILRELNQSALFEFNEIYAEINQHLMSLRVVPTTRARIVNRSGMGARASSGGPAAPGGELDIMSLFKRMFTGGGAGKAAANVPAAPAPQPAAEADPLTAMAEARARRYVPNAPLPPTPSGYVPGAPIMVTADLGEGLARLQHGETGFTLGGGIVEFSGVPQGKHNVLRDLQQSSLGQRVNQLESMTIELVAMLFDFIFETKDLPDGIKALLARLQIPVLKAAMLDGAFFAKKSHPSRLLVNELAQAGLGWSTEMGSEDPLYRKLDEIVHRILDGFADDLTIFEEMRTTLTQFLEQEERAAELNIKSSADEVHERDRHQLAANVARSEIERRIETHPLPNFLAEFLRSNWTRALEYTYLEEGEESDAWAQRLSTLEDLVWSVQPKKSGDDRKRLVALLPSLLKRMNVGLQQVPWARNEREQFMANLVEAHAAAVKPSLAAVPSPTFAVAEQARADAEQAKSIGDFMGAARAEQLAQAMSPAAPPMVEVPEIVADHYLEIAQSLERGMWVEFEGEDGQLSFAKLAWVSPLRGTYLFTNRQGQKAMSMTADELAQQFRNDRARMVEAEPLIDRAFTSVMANMGNKYPAAA
ncbi:MAG: DUF1631 domain-containing protein [Pseudomonadota bacterium]|nr:DUF1631 domain-containing protein [Pseudomonadota bacterium]